MLWSWSSVNIKWKCSIVFLTNGKVQIPITQKPELRKARQPKEAVADSSCFHLTSNYSLSLVSILVSMWTVLCASPHLSPERLGVMCIVQGHTGAKLLQLEGPTPLLRVVDSGMASDLTWASLIRSWTVWLNDQAGEGREGGKDLSARIGLAREELH